MYLIPEVQTVKIFVLLQNDFGSSGTWNCIKKDARWETHAVMTCSKILCSNYRGLCCITFFIIISWKIECKAACTINAQWGRNAWYLLLHSKTQTVSSECNSVGTQTPVRFLNLHQLQRWMLPKNLSLVCLFKAHAWKTLPWIHILSISNGIMMSNISTCNVQTLLIIFITFQICLIITRTTSSTWNMFSVQQTERDDRDRSVVE